MMDTQYVLCRWKERLWPAKVLSQTGISRRQHIQTRKAAFLEVQILSLDEKIKVKKTETKILQQSQIEEIAAEFTTQVEINTTPIEELIYRRSLRVALDTLSGKADASQVNFLDKSLTTPVLRKVKQTRPAHAVSESGSSPFVCEEIVGGSGPFKKENALQRLSSSPIEENKFKKGLKRSNRIYSKETESLASQTGNVFGTQKPQHRNCEISKARSRTWKNRKQKKDDSSQNSQLNLKKKPEVKDSRKKGRKRPWTWNRNSSPFKARGCNGTNTELEELSPLLSSSSIQLVTLEEKASSPVQKALDFSTSHSFVESECENEHGKMPSQKYCKVLGGIKQSSVSECHCVEPGGTGLSTSGFDPSCFAPKMRALKLPDFEEDEEELQASEQSLEFSTVNTTVVDEEEEDEELPSILSHPEPCSIEAGMLVWCKHQKYPYWPAVVKSIKWKDKKASILYIEENMNPEKKGFIVRLRRLKHFDCEEKQELMDKAKEDYSQAVDWCIKVISDYRIRIGCGSFAGSFLEYYSADISCPVRKVIQQAPVKTVFPTRNMEDDTSLNKKQLFKKILPDRRRAARNKANEKLVEYIVNEKGAEKHLLAILKSRKKSSWLKEFLNSSQYLTCIETYLEDDEQLDLVVKYLQGVYQKIDSKMPTLINGDGIKFILHVLLPEAIIYAISAIDEIDYQTAEEKYRKGPSVSNREREMFDKELLEKKQETYIVED
ncbi:PWWP domain-containing protein MUM1 [Vombatus ursinus]|uniref:PWWP domain containing 3A, DNA repair factor n=1 Tax=Vombatus ursinus TaxID=29139 RepID=A0A4X2LIS4_VOMUR|nr:PWWP domain-containing protein MUM1 [Vombatus ursinus]XP_027709002.1 PWWP domain-containing protein MUM1 [Vombatus ursinus]XP_027709003.1 PWWP domain-containing protein MUM1 [Vombatus ursinus]XP_027709004.1 PWWP domain-containing protein MUM1 [Vombatus ursinus]XP_027709005.1 PWWP domain-containing protein MUM1 [Vombatus ursinus]XP_027709006.1 PWWP domain-containing protein MUM1 [Vombatus ursinus]